MNLKTLPIAAAAILLAVSSPSLAENKEFTANLTGTAEVPPTDSGGAGIASISYDAATQTLKYKVTFDGLSGPATAAHIHGPATDGANAPPIIDIGVMNNPSEGTANLNKEQEKLLNDGMAYVNIHTAKFPNGEIRGQLKPN